MKVKGHNKGKKNNKGMSLIELVVAITILTIAVIPLLHSFVLSAQYNLRARTKMRATVTAQTIMENFKAYTVEEICRQFDSNFSETFAIDQDSITGLLEQVGGSSMVLKDPSDPSKGYVFEPSADDKYEYTIRGICYESSRFDAKIELTPHGGHLTTVKVEDKNPNRDAVYIDEMDMEAQDIAAYEEMLNLIAEQWDAEESRSVETHVGGEVATSTITITKHQMTFTARKEDGKDKLYVCHTYTFKVDGHFCSRPVDVSDPENTDTVPGTFDMGETVIVGTEKLLYEKSGGAEGLQNLYIYYYPVYSTGPRDSMFMGRDEIKIENLLGGDPLKVYIYKQKNPFITALNSKETSYQAVIETTNAWIIDDNFGINLTHNASSSSVTAPSITPSSSRYTGVDTQTSDIKQRMYNITVKVYEEGQYNAGFTGTPISELTSTIIE